MENKIILPQTVDSLTAITHAKYIEYRRAAVLGPFFYKLDRTDF